MTLSLQHLRDDPHEGVGRPLRILIVEDVPEDVELITLTLDANAIAFSYDNVASAAKAREHLDTHRYDVVLSDYSLAQFNGLQAFDLLKKSGQDIPFILVTGSLGEEAAVECIKSGMTDYVLKDRLFRLPSVLERALQEFELRRQQQLALTKLQGQARREAMVNRIVQAMRETLILENVLQTTVDQLQDVLEISRAIIFQPSAGQDNRAAIAYISRSAAQRDNLLGVPSDLYTHYQQLLMEKRSALLQPHEALPKALKQEAEIGASGSSLLVPLLYQKNFLGGICLQHMEQERSWTDDELGIISTIADQCAIAIHQARLYQQAQSELAERQRIEAQLRHDAFHDALTGLPNRALFIDRLEHALQLSRRRIQRSEASPGFRFAVLFLDLDRFKVINDSLGHTMGDQLLQTVAELLKASVRRGDTIARLGGDEFVILLEDLEDAGEAIEVTLQIHQQLKRPILLQGEEVFISTSIGITLNSDHYTSPDQMLRDADTAMYRAKRVGRGNYAVFDASMHVVALRQLQIENDLQRAIDREEFLVHYQPIVNLSDRSIEGFEALVRWQHPEEGLIAPGEFIPVAEETGLVAEIDLWVLRQAAAQLRHWQHDFPELPELSVSVNLSGKHFAKGGLIPRIDEVLSITGISGARLKIEITEGVLIDNSEFAARILGQLRERQIQVCLDDFGTRYSSLNYLHRFPISCLKIDRTFVTSLEADPDKREIVRAIASLAMNLQIGMVAEGLESAGQLAFLRSIDCHAGQGYYFSRPLDADGASDLLRRRHLP